MSGVRSLGLVPVRASRVLSKAVSFERGLFLQYRFDFEQAIGRRNLPAVTPGVLLDKLLGRFTPQGFQVLQVRRSVDDGPAWWMIGVGAEGTGLTFLAGLGWFGAIHPEQESAGRIIKKLVSPGSGSEPFCAKRRHGFARR